jgi:hypothetical protein
MRENKLCRCPRCGCNKVYYKRFGNRWHVECNACHLKGPLRRFKFRARKVWACWHKWLWGDELENLPGCVW